MYGKIQQHLQNELNTIEQNKISIKRCIPRALGHHRELLKALQDSYDLHKPTTHTVLYNYTW